MLENWARCDSPASCSTVPHHHHRRLHRFSSVGFLDTGAQETPEAQTPGKGWKGGHSHSVVSIYLFSILLPKDWAVGGFLPSGTEVSAATAETESWAPGPGSGWPAALVTPCLNCKRDRTLRPHLWKNRPREWKFTGGHVLGFFISCLSFCNYRFNRAIQPFSLAC